MSFLPSSSSMTVGRKSPTHALSTRVVNVAGDFCNETTFTECNVVCERSYFHQSGAEGFSIFHPSVAMAYDRLKHVMHVKFRQSTFEPKTYLYSEDFYNVAWHVRVGDINLYADNPGLFQGILILVCCRIRVFPVVCVDMTAFGVPERGRHENLPPSYMYTRSLTSCWTASG